MLISKEHKLRITPYQLPNVFERETKPNRYKYLIINKNRKIDFKEIEKPY